MKKYDNYEMGEDNRLAPFKRTIRIIQLEFIT